MSKENFLIEHQEGTIWALGNHFPYDDELMEIFESMTKDQLYAVSCLMNKKEEKFFYIEDLTHKYGKPELDSFTLIAIRFGNQEYRSALKPLGQNLERGKYEIFRDFVEEVKKFGCPYADANEEGLMKISLKEIKEKVSPVLISEILTFFKK